jgi:hypothetical protein
MDSRQRGDYICKLIVSAETCVNQLRKAQKIV